MATSMTRGDGMSSIMASLICLLIMTSRVHTMTHWHREDNQILDAVDKRHFTPDNSRSNEVFKRASVNSVNSGNLTGKSTRASADPAPLSPSETHDSCISEVFPCSNYVGGNLVLVLYYGLTLGFGAKLISDGAEMLLDVGVAPALIGGVILPVSGVVPDSMMILVSGLGSKEAAQQQISVGMGTLAGSTILLLTLAWSASLVVGRVDLVQAPTCFGLVASPDARCSKGLRPYTQGVEVSKEVTISAFVMLVTMLPYFIIQSADWYFGPKLPSPSSPPEQQPHYVSAAALITFIFSITGFVLYLAMQWRMSQEGSNVRMTVHAKEKEHQMLLKAAKAFYMANLLRGPTGAPGYPFSGGGKTGGAWGSNGGGQQHQSQYGYTQLQDNPDYREHMLEKKYFATWRIHARVRKHHRDNMGDIESSDGGGGHYGAIEGGGEQQGEGIEMHKMQNGSVGGDAQKKEKTEGEREGEGTSSEKESRSLVMFKSLALLTTGVGLVTVFSDPMCDTLSRLTDPKLRQHLPISPFYVSFVVTPLCSNASELISSISFAMKKEKDNLVLTYTQLYSAAIMNNTLCLGVFCGLVFFRGLQWHFSAEVTAILAVEAAMGVVALKYRRVYQLWLSVPVAIIYFLSLVLVAFLEGVLHWG